MSDSFICGVDSNNNLYIDPSFNDSEVFEDLLSEISENSLLSKRAAELLSKLSGVECHLDKVNSFRSALKSRICWSRLLGSHWSVSSDGRLFRVCRYSLLLYCQ